MSAINFDLLKTEIVSQVKDMLSGLADDARNLQPVAETIAQEALSYAKQAVEGKDVSVLFLHLRAQAEMLAGLLVVKANARVKETVFTILDTAARILMVALKAAA